MRFFCFCLLHILCFESIGCHAFPVRVPDATRDDRVTLCFQFPNAGAESETSVSFDRLLHGEFLTVEQVGEDRFFLREACFFFHGMWFFGRRGPVGEGAPKGTEKMIRFCLHRCMMVLVSVAIEQPIPERFPSEVVSGLLALLGREEFDLFAGDVVQTEEWSSVDVRDLSPLHVECAVEGGVEEFRIDFDPIRVGEGQKVPVLDPPPQFGGESGIRFIGYNRGCFHVRSLEKIVGEFSLFEKLHPRDKCSGRGERTFYMITDFMPCRKCGRVERENRLVDIETGRKVGSYFCAGSV